MTIKIIDTYSNGEFNPHAWVEDGYTGVIFKAGQGAWADVPRYHPAWWRQAKDAGLYVGWYWLCDSRRRSSEHIDEMNRFHLFDDLGELGLWVDVEKPIITMKEKDYWKTPFAGHQNLVDFMYLLTLKDIMPGIYTGPGAYELVTRRASRTSHEYLAQFDLWTAQYYDNYQPGISQPRLYGAWTEWEWWQWREGPDINIFSGSDFEFVEKYGHPVPPTGQPPDQIPPGDNQMKFKATSQFAMSIRSDHNTFSPKLGTLPIGQPAYGDNLWVAPVSGNQVLAGDTWLQTQTLTWIALIHMGKRYCTLEQLAPEEPQPPIQPTLPERVILQIQGVEYGYKPED